jgi:hypothetical protein
MLEPVWYRNKVNTVQQFLVQYQTKAMNLNADAGLVYLMPMPNYVGW